jgi:hypothetical protein
LETEDNIDTGIVALVIGLVGIYWFALILRRDFKKKNFLQGISLFS